MTKGKELTSAASTEIAVATDMESWGDFDGGASELVIPKCLLMQGQSKLVSDDKAATGEWRNSVTGELIAKKGEEFELIPFHFERYWAIAEKDGSKFRRIETLTAANENLPWDFQDNDGVACKRTYVRSFYCLDTKDLDGLPIVISFSSTAAKVGKNLWTRMYMMNRQAGKIPCAFPIKVTSSMVKGEKGAYAAPDFTVNTTEISAETAVVCRNWMLSIKAGDAKADSSDEVAQPTTSGQTETGMGENTTAAGTPLGDF